MIFNWGPSPNNWDWRIRFCTLIEGIPFAVTCDRKYCGLFGFCPETGNAQELQFHVKRNYFGGGVRHLQIKPSSKMFQLCLTRDHTWNNLGAGSWRCLTIFDVRQKWLVPWNCRFKSFRKMLCQAVLSKHTVSIYNVYTPLLPHLPIMFFRVAIHFYG